MNVKLQEEKIDTVREAVGVFHNENELLATMDELQIRGFARSYFSVLADAKAVEEKLGHIYKRVEELEDDPNVPRGAIYCPECIGNIEGALLSYPLYIAATTATAMVVASGGTLLTAITAAVVAGIGGGTIGGILASLVGQHHSDYLQEQIDRGGILLWVQVPDAEHEEQALSILKKYSAHDVHVHDIAVSGL